VEKNAIEDTRERVAIAHAIEKLKVDGPALYSWRLRDRHGDGLVAGGL